MFIEDLIATAVRLIKMNSWDANIMSSFRMQTINGNGLTQKQSAIVLKILKKHLTQLNLILGTDLSGSIISPIYKIPLRSTPSEKKISVAADKNFEKVFKLEFPYNQKIVNIIREKRDSLGNCFWDKDSKSWIFSISESSIVLLMWLKKEFAFEADEEFLNFEKQSQTIIDNAEHYAPMLIKDEDIFRFKNVFDEIKDFQSTDLLEALFFAKKIQVSIWDNEIEKEVLDKISNRQKDSVSLSFIRQNPKEHFSINLEEFAIDSLTTIIKNMSPVLIIIPGGSEMEKLKELVNFLNSAGIKNQEMSVLFRTAGENSAKFSSYVRENLLNLPISGNTKVFFISHKMRKSIVAANVYFNCVINFNAVNVHTTLQRYLMWQHNVINVLEKKSQKEINFAFL